MANSTTCHCGDTYMQHVALLNGRRDGYPGKCTVPGCECPDYCSEDEARATCGVPGCECTEGLRLVLLCKDH